MLNYIAPAMTTEEVEAAQAKAAESNGPRELAPKGNYKVRVHSMKGRTYTRKDGSGDGELASLFFINLEGRFKGAELTLFRKGGNPATTTSSKQVIALLTAAGLSPSEVAATNWAIDSENPVDDKGNVVAAFVKPDGSTVNVEGLELEAFIDIEENDDGYKRNVILGLRPIS